MAEDIPNPYRRRAGREPKRDDAAQPAEPTGDERSDATVRIVIDGRGLDRALATWLRAAVRRTRGFGGAVA